MEKTNIILKRLIPFVVLFMLFSQTEMKAQMAVTAIDENLNLSVASSCADGAGNLYILHTAKLMGYRIADLHVRKWNGLFWSNLPVLRVEEFLHTSVNELTMGFYKGKLHVAGSFRAANGIRGIAQFSGTSWEPLAGGLYSNYLIHEEISVQQIQEYDNKLFVHGDFNRADNKSVKNFAYFEGGNWTGINIKSGRLSGLQVVNDTLFAAGIFSEVDGVMVENLAMHVGGKWMPVSNGFSTPILGLTKLDGDLVAITSSGFYRKESSSWKRMSTNDFMVNQVTSVVQVRDELYTVGRFVKNGKEIRLMRISGDSAHFILAGDEIRYNLNATLHLEEALDGMLFLLGSFSKIQNQSLQNVAVFKPGFSVVFGKAYIDHNQNCTFDFSDEPITNALISLNEGSYFTSTDSFGNYQILIPSASDAKLEIIPAASNTPSCLGGQRDLDMSLIDRRVEVDFPMNLKPALNPEVKFSSGSGFVVKHGFVGTYLLDISSVDANKFPITTTLKFDERLVDFNSSENYRCAKDGEITWVLKENTRIELTFRIDPVMIQMNDTLRFTLRTSDVVEKWTRTSDLKQVVVSAYDPNDKQCEASEIEIGTQNLSYHVRFQNLGTASATDVHIVDTIDKNLPIEYIQIIGNSHFTKYATSYKVRGHAIIWSFKGINLPPKQDVGDELSGGFVSYKNGLSNQLSIGQTINNKAYIYFDFQPPVVTNTTITTVVESTPGGTSQGKQVKLYPNPAVDMFTIYSPVSNMVELEIYTRDGRLLQWYKLETPSAKAEVSVTDLSTGIYFVRIKHYTGFETLPLLVN